MSFEVRLNKQKIRIGKLATAHGTIDTPVFMPVGTLGSVKGVAWDALAAMGAQIVLANTYHLYLRPGTQFLKSCGGLHRFINWQGPILTDSGGFQVFSLGARKWTSRLEEHIDNGEAGESLVKIRKDGVKFKSHLDGSTHFFTPESVIDAQIAFGSDIMMVLDVCTEYPATWTRAKETMEKTHLWAKQAINYFNKLKEQGVGKQQKLFGIIQGSTYEDLRIESAKFISSLGFDGIAIGGVSVGEGKANMRKVLDWVMPYIPADKPRYLMGVGEPDDLVDAIKAGIDMFDCVLPTRLGRHGTVWRKIEAASYQKIDLRRGESRKSMEVIDRHCACSACTGGYSQAYLSHLLREHEMIGMRLASEHNLQTILDLVSELRADQKGIVKAVKRV